MIYWVMFVIPKFLVNDWLLIDDTVVYGFVKVDIDWYLNTLEKYLNTLAVLGYLDTI